MESGRGGAAGGRAVRIGGPATSRHSVLLLPDPGDRLDTFDAVCTRLHNSGLRTVVVEPGAELDTAALLAVLDELTLPWVNLVGHRGGADLAWRAAAATFGRFVSLVAIDRPHPAAGPHPAGQDPCPPVELPTTLIAGAAVTQDAAVRTGRQVFADFRLVRLDGVADVPADASHELATEIVLRSSAW